VDRSEQAEVSGRSLTGDEQQSHSWDLDSICNNEALARCAGCGLNSEHCG
jgi:hypothetical protein